MIAQYCRTQAYVGERCVGEEREAFKKVLVIIVLDHRRPVSLRKNKVSDRETREAASRTRWSSVVLNKNNFIPGSW